MNCTALKKSVMTAGKAFIKRSLAPAAARIDEEETFPWDNFKQMGRLGLLGIQYPEEFNGAGLDYVTYVNILKEMAMACASTAMTVVSHAGLTCNPIFEYGSAQQKEKYLKPLIVADKIGAFALTEADSGSDMAAMQTRATAMDDHYVLNGSKIFITNANVADVYVVAAKTAPQNGIMGISLFILEKGMPGVAPSGKREKKLGMRGSDTGELVFKNARVPKQNLLGKQNSGFEILHRTLVGARLGMAAIAIGISQGALAHCLQYARKRKQFDQPIYKFQLIKNMLANMEMSINAASLLLHKAAVMKDLGLTMTKEASEAKLFASETATRATKDAIQIFGAYGYCRDLPLERFYRDAKITEIGDGTSEIQRLIIADELIKRNRSAIRNASAIEDNQLWGVL
jgi:alkylation response protein AidB-like acyl-CoA dehydrogenase